MLKKYKKIVSGMICSAMILSFGKYATVSDGINIGISSYMAEKRISKSVSESDKAKSVRQLKYENISDSKNNKYELVDKNGELKETVIVEDEEEYYDNDNRLIIEYKNGAKESDELLKYVEKEKEIDDKIKVYKVKSKNYTKKVIEIIKEHSSDIQIAQPDYIFNVASKKIQEESEENDYYKSGEQWALENDGTFEAPDEAEEDADIKAVEDIDLNAEGAWKQINESQHISDESNQVIVAVVDTGIDYTHDELKDVIWQNEDESVNKADSDKNGYKDDIRGWNFESARGSNDVSDDNGHGTAVAGVIAAANDNKGIVGIASNINIRIMPVKSIDSEGSATMSNLIAGMKYADQNGASICNCSWGGESNAWEIFQNTLMEQVIVNSNMLFVAASGNESDNIDRTEYIPASFSADNFITVGSIEWDGSLSWFSNYGASSMEVCAPGAAIYTLKSGGGYVCEWGTSFSAPYVVGVAALAQAASNSSDGKILKSLICNSDTVKEISGLSMYCSYSGIPDAEKVVNAALLYREMNETAEASPSPSVSETPTSTPQITETPYNDYTEMPVETSDASATSTPTITEEPQVTSSPAENTDMPTVTVAPTEGPVSTISPEQDTLSEKKDVDITVKNNIYKGYARKINVKLNGDILQVKYSKGKKDLSYFNKFGNDYENINKNNFNITAYQPGWYSVYVKTTDGNETIKNIFANVKIIKISKTKLKLKEGAEYKLTASIKNKEKYPERLTGNIYFKTSNKKIVSVNSNTGKIKVKSKGKAFITAYMKNGKSAKCKVVVQ